MPTARPAAPKASAPARRCSRLSSRPGRSATPTCPPTPASCKQPGAFSRRRRQASGLELDRMDFVEPLAGFVEIGEHPEGALPLFRQRREFPYELAPLAVDHDRRGAALWSLGRATHKREQRLEALHVSVGVYRGDVDEFAIVQRTLLDSLPNRLLQLFGSDGAVGDGNQQTVMVGNTDVNRHVLARRVIRTTVARYKQWECG